MATKLLRSSKSDFRHPLTLASTDRLGVSENLRGKADARVRRANDDRIGRVKASQIRRGVGWKLCHSPAMRFFLNLILTAVVLTDGCSKPSQPAQTNQEPDKNVQNTVAGKSAFRSRSNVTPADNEAPASANVDPSRPTAKLSPLAALKERQQALAQNQALIPEVAPTASTNTPPVNPDDLPQEGDQIWVPIKLLGVLLPGVNLDAITRTEPMDVKSLLDQKGIVVTNYQQLIEMGITNYQIVRAQKPITAKATQ